MTTPFPKELAMFAASGKQLDDLLDIVRSYGAAEYKRGIEALQAVTAERDALAVANRDLQDWFDAAIADAKRYEALRTMAVELSLPNDTIAMLLKDVTELDAAMKGTS